MTDYHPYLSRHEIDKVYDDRDPDSISTLIDDLYRLRDDVIDATEAGLSRAQVVHECRLIAARIKTVDR